MQALRSLVNKALFTTGGRIAVGSVAATVVASFNVESEVKDFFQYKFTTKKNPDAIVDFYSTEEFLQILGVLPFATNMILAGVVWDEAAENTNTVWNTMRISFDITEKEEEIDGKDVVTFFNKRERFVQYFPYTKFLLWDQVQNYGYRRLDDGTIEVSHQGESFYGPWPVRFLVNLHAMYVIWATEKHVNSDLFGTEDLDAIEHQRANIPAHVVKEWISSLTTRQEENVKKTRLAGKNSENQEATLDKLKKLQRTQTSIAVERMPGQQGVLSGNVRVKVDDPEAQKAIRDALKDIKQIEGKDTAAAQLSQLLNSSQAGSSMKVLDKKAEKKGAAVEESSKENLNYGWEETTKYKGAFKAVKRVNRQPSSTPDEMALWRTEARSLRLMELFDEASDAMNKRPEQVTVRALPEGLDFEDVIEKASHRACSKAWDAYTQCKSNRKGSHEKCNGWWRGYAHCLENSGPRLVLAALEGVAQYDPDQNIERLRQ